MARDDNAANAVAFYSTSTRFPAPPGFTHRQLRDLANRDPALRALGRKGPGRLGWIITIERWAEWLTGSTESTGATADLARAGYQLP